MALSFGMSDYHGCAGLVGEDSSKVGVGERDRGVQKFIEEHRFLGMSIMLPDGSRMVDPGSCRKDQ